MQTPASQPNGNPYQDKSCFGQHRLRRRNNLHYLCATTLSNRRYCQGWAATDTTDRLAIESQRPAVFDGPDSNGGAITPTSAAGPKAHKKTPDQIVKDDW